MLRDRTIQSLVIASLLCVAAGLPSFRASVQGVPPDCFWNMKIRWAGDFDFVVCGDSRVYRGVAPPAIEQRLPGFRIANFGFGGSALTRDYLQATRLLLDRESPCPVVVVGVTPHSLTPRAAADNQFRDLNKREYDATPPHPVIDRLLHFFRPYGWKVLLDALRGHSYYERYCSDGWVASSQVPEDPRRACRAYGRIFEHNRVDPAVVEGLIETVAAWTAQGIRVYGLRPPTCTAMAELEDANSGFDERMIRDAFIAAGARWLTFPASGYHSYDGSHLREDAARGFSRDLALAIRQDLQQCVEAWGRSGSGARRSLSLGTFTGDSAEVDR